MPKNGEGYLNQRTIVLQINHVRTGSRAGLQMLLSDF